MIDPQVWRLENLGMDEENKRHSSWLSRTLPTFHRVVIRHKLFQIRLLTVIVTTLVFGVWLYFFIDELRRDSQKTGQSMGHTFRIMAKDLNILLIIVPVLVVTVTAVVCEQILRFVLKKRR